MGPVFRQFKAWRCPTPAGSRGSIGAPLSHIDPNSDGGLTRGLYQGSRTIRRVQRRKRFPKSRQKKAICAVPAWPATPSVQARRQLLPCGRGDGADNELEACRALNSAGLSTNAKFAAGSRKANVLTTPSRGASGLLQQAAGVITDFSAGNAVLGCCRRPTVRRGSRCVPRR